MFVEGKCKWSYGPSCPVVLSIKIFIHNSLHFRRKLQYVYFSIAISSVG